MTESVFDKIEYSMIDTIDTVREYRGEYVLGGLFLGLTHPSIGWALMSLLMFMPTIVILKHPEWLDSMKDEKIEHVLLLMLLIASSDMYAGHCLAKAVGLNWP
jgi:hypothetical protein